MLGKTSGIRRYYRKLTLLIRRLKTNFHPRPNYENRLFSGVLMVHNIGRIK